jgi:hypothetical protein
VRAQEIREPSLLEPAFGRHGTDTDNRYSHTTKVSAPNNKKKAPAAENQEIKGRSAGKIN